MPRVSGRAEALARIGSRRAAYLAIILIASSIVASYFILNNVTAILIVVAVLSYAFIYTLYLKKSSPYGTVTGGIPGALPVLIGYSAVSPHIGVDGFILFFVMLLWQPPHFLALALKYRVQYAAAGIPVMPVALGEPYTKAFIFIYATALLPLSLSLFLLGYCSVYFAVVSVSLGIFLLALYYLQLVRKDAYGRAFGASIFYIVAVLTAVVADLGLGLN
jgi:protoheme IX farnesyltransferase